MDAGIGAVTGDPFALAETPTPLRWIPSLARGGVTNGSYIADCPRVKLLK